jgi:multimeric flavodoxin WrbA
MTAPEPRNGMPDPPLTEPEFKQRFVAQFADPTFDTLSEQVAALAGAAWEGYRHARKSPRTRKAGAQFSDPDYDLSIDWIAAHEAIEAAQRQHENASAASRFLLINASPRSEHTCPGEMSKSYRLISLTREVLEAEANVLVDVLDLSRLASEYGRHIYPCKSCFSTAAALCHWPCSCYPNYALGQTQDWMNEIYPRWVAAHGVMIITPVHWFHGSSALKLMMDRLVCADGGNPDPTRTHGKDAKAAKELELAGWDYARPLEGRLFACLVHGDVEGAEETRRALCDWLSALHLVRAGREALLNRYIGYWQPYASSHQELDADPALQEEVRNSARAVLDGVRRLRAGRMPFPESKRAAPRDKQSSPAGSIAQPRPLVGIIWAQASLLEPRATSSRGQAKPAWVG